MILSGGHSRHLLLSYVSMDTRVYPLWSNEELFPEKTLTLAVKVEMKIFVGSDGELNV